MIGGLLLIVAGHVGTFWCYRSMGDAWRMGINRRERNTLVTRGPYRFVRHPIYSFQVVILVGVLLLLPTLMAVLIIGTHVLCVLIKAADEESHLLSVHGETYRQYLSSTGRLWPRLRQPPASGG
jgi:protein-S-isoprenylcysteine O-methyltransferase Ste14